MEDLNQHKVDELNDNNKRTQRMDLSSLEICPYIRRFPTGRKRCAVMICQRNARSKGELCIRHGGGERCAAPDCMKASRDSRGYCIKHGGGRRCSKPGCKRGAADKCDGLCVRHYKQLNALHRRRKYRGGDEDDDYDDDSDYESTSSLSLGSKKVEIVSQRIIKRHRAQSTSTSSSRATLFDTNDSIDSVQSIGEDVEDIFVTNNDHTNQNETKNPMAKPASTPTLTNLGRVISANDVFYSDPYPLTRAAHTRAAHHLPFGSISTYSSITPPPQLPRTAQKQLNERDFINNSPFKTLQSQIVLSRTYQQAFQYNPTPFQQNLVMMGHVDPASHVLNNVIPGFQERSGIQPVYMPAKYHCGGNNFVAQQRIITGSNDIFASMIGKKF